MKSAAAAMPYALDALRSLSCITHRVLRLADGGRDSCRHHACCLTGVLSQCSDGFQGAISNLHGSTVNFPRKMINTDCQMLAGCVPGTHIQNRQQYWTRVLLQSQVLVASSPGTKACQRANDNAFNCSNIFTALPLAEASYLFCCSDTRQFQGQSKGEVFLHLQEIKMHGRQLLRSVAIIAICACVHS